MELDWGGWSIVGVVFCKGGPREYVRFWISVWLIGIGLVGIEWLSGTWSRLKRVKCSECTSEEVCYDGRIVVVGIKPMITLHNCTPSFMAHLVDYSTSPKKFSLASSSIDERECL